MSHHKNLCGSQREEVIKGNERERMTIILVFFLTIVFVRFEPLLCITAMIMGRVEPYVLKITVQENDEDLLRKVIDLLRKLMFGSPYTLLGQLLHSL